MKNKTLHKNNHLKQNKFTVPKGYFNTLEDVVIAKLKAEALNPSPNNDIPKNYFNSLENLVIQNVNKAKKAKLIKLFLPVAVAASIVMAVVLNNFNSGTNTTISKNEIETWLNLQMVENTTLDLVAAQSDLELETTFFETVSNEEIVNYLNETEIENILYEN